MDVVSVTSVHLLVCFFVLMSVCTLLFVIVFLCFRFYGLLFFVFFFFFYFYGDHRDLHVLTHSFPTRRSSDLCLALHAGQPCAFGFWIGCTSGIGQSLCWHCCGDDAGGCPWSTLWRLDAGSADFLGRGVESLYNRRCLRGRSEEHTSELQSLMRISYAVFCLKKKRIDKQ